MSDRERDEELRDLTDEEAEASNVRLDIRAREATKDELVSNSSASN